MFYRIYARRQSVRFSGRLVWKVKVKLGKPGYGAVLLAGSSSRFQYDVVEVCVPPCDV